MGMDISMSFSNILINGANKIKPFLVKIIPISFLRLLKKKVLNRTVHQLKQIEKQPFKSDKYPRGINVVASIKEATGLGQSSRLIENVLLNSNIDYTIYNFMQITKKSIEDNSLDRKITNEFKYGVNLFHINAHEFPLAVSKIGTDKWDYRYNIAFWLWELEEFPDEWTECLNLLDEIWTPAEFVSEGIRKKTKLPVKTLPYCVTVPTEVCYNREYFNLPTDKFLFLTMYDSNSIMERKNPKGVLEAFRTAFCVENEKVGIVIKINSPKEEELKIIGEVLGGYTNVYLVTDNLEKVQVNSLIKAVDVFVSLHRAEGFGLVLAEAMLLGTPTIATNWSANTEFMNKDVAGMVDYTIITLEKDIFPYKKGNRWADPDIGQAAKYMKRYYEDKNYYNRIREKALSYSQEKLGIKKAVDLIENRVNEIYGENG